MKPFWVVVANSSRARIFKAEKRGGPLGEVEDLVHPESRLREQELVSDLPGRSFDSGGEGRHAMEQKVSPKQQESIRFAKEICEHINAAYNDGKYGKLYVVAAPAFLGAIRNCLNGALRGNVAGEIAKDLTEHSMQDIRKHLPDYL